LIFSVNIIPPTLLSEGQGGEAWEPSDKAMIYRISGGTGQKSTFNLSSVCKGLDVPLIEEDILSVFGTTALLNDRDVVQRTA
jgi:hypothetical protein